MDRKKHKRNVEDIMKPSDIKKSRLQRVGQGPSTSSASTGSIKSKLDFSDFSSKGKSPVYSGNNGNSGGSLRPLIDDKWKEFGETINLNADTFRTSVKEALEQEKLNKVERMIVAVLRNFLTVNADKITVDLRLLGTIAEIFKEHGAKIKNVNVHRGLLYIICNSKQLPDNVQRLFISITTCLASKQTSLDKCYLIALLNDSVGVNSGLGISNRCIWIEKPYAQELVQLIMRPFATILPSVEVFSNCLLSGTEKLAPPEYFPEMKPGIKSAEQLIINNEFLRSWFEHLKLEFVPKSLFRALSILCGSELVRHFIATRMEIWMNAQKYNREISELLLIMCSNLNGNEYQTDREVIEMLLKLNNKNMKSRVIAQPYHFSLKCAYENENNTKYFIEALMVTEFGPVQNKTASNLNMLVSVISAKPEFAIRCLAQYMANEVLTDFDVNCVKVRNFIKELTRGLPKGTDFRFSLFVEEFLDYYGKKIKNQHNEQMTKIAFEIITQVPLAALIAQLAKNENAFSLKLNLITPEAVSIREKFHKEYQLYCETILKWLVINKSKFIDEERFTRLIYIFLYLENRDYYISMEASAVNNENDFQLCVRLFAESSISENMLWLLLGREKCEITQKHVIDLVAVLTDRAAQNWPRFMRKPLLEFDDLESIVERLLAITKFPEVPNLSSKLFYGIAWNTIVMWLSGGELPDDFKKIYQSYPMVRYLTLCIMQKKYEYPMDFEGKSAKIRIDEDLETNIKVSAMIEKGLNVPATHCCIFNPTESLTTPAFKELKQFVAKCHPTSRLARCADPPLLDELVRNVGAENSLAAICELLNNDAMCVGLLSTDCLFHAIKHYMGENKGEDEAQFRMIQETLLQRAQNEMENDDSQLLSKLLKGLSSVSIEERNVSKKTLARIFGSDQHGIDVNTVANLKAFKSREKESMIMLAEAARQDMDVHTASTYMKYLSNNLASSVMHDIAEVICDVCVSNRFELRNHLAEFFVKYIDRAVEQQAMSAESPNVDMFEIASEKIFVCTHIPNAIIHLLATYPCDLAQSDHKFYDQLAEVWLTPGVVPKRVNRATNESETILTTEIRKKMLRSKQKMVIKAALEGISMKDAKDFLLVSQMTKETAEIVLEKAKNVDMDGIGTEQLSIIYIVMKGYELKGVKNAQQLAEKAKQRLDHLKSLVKDEPVVVSQVFEMPKPSSVVSSALNTNESLMKIATIKMSVAETMAFLKKNCSSVLGVQNKIDSFSLPPEFIQTVIDDEKAAMNCVQHIEANLKFFLSNENAFRLLMTVVDTASQKFIMLQKKIETLAVRLLKSVDPPACVLGILNKFASRSNANKVAEKKPDEPVIEEMSKLVEILKNESSNEKKQELINRFLKNGIKEKEVKPEDVAALLTAMWNSFGEKENDVLANKCLSMNWSVSWKKRMCQLLLQNYQEEVPVILVGRLIESYCRAHPIESIRFLFRKRDGLGYSLNETALESAAMYFAEMASHDNAYEVNISGLFAIMEEQEGIHAMKMMGEHLLDMSCYHESKCVRNSAQLLLDALTDRCAYLSYRRGISSTMRIIPNVETREACIKRCERIVDRIIEIGTDNMMVEDMCEEEKSLLKQAKEEQYQQIGSKRMPDFKRGGPNAKKGKYEKGNVQTIEDSKDDGSLALVDIALLQFDSMIVDHASIAKAKFPVIANYISQLNSMNRSELKEENRIKKVFFVLRAAIKLCDKLSSGEFGAIETVLNNCFEFYEKHIEEGLVHIKEQISFSELMVRACVKYLHSNNKDAIVLISSNRAVMSRICQRCQNQKSKDVERIKDTLALKGMKYNIMC